MKLIATSNFRNPNPQLVQVRNPRHELHVHKGDEVSINENTPDGQRMIALLNLSGRLVDPKDKDQYDRLAEEIAADKKAEAAAAEAQKKADAANVKAVEQLVAFMKANAKAA